MMEKRYLPLLATLLTINVGFSQHAPQSRADSLKESGQLTLAIQAYADNYAMKPLNRSNTYNYACALALHGQNDSAFHYLRIALGRDTSVRALNEPDFYYLLSDERWKDIEDMLVQRVEAKYGAYEDLELSKELWRMKIKDQAFYYELDVAEKAVGRESPIVDALWELKSKINRENLARVEQIIAEGGWPKQSVVKSSAATTVFLVIQHSDLETQAKYLPIMKEAADNGEANWRSLALLIDRVHLGQGKQQIYGSQISIDDEGKYMVRDLMEPEYVNQRRREVGLGPIEEYVSFWGIEWKIEQKEK